MSTPASGVAESIQQSEKEQATKRLILFHLIPVVLNLWILVKMVPVFAEIYQGFGAKLPALVQLVIQFSHVIQNHFFLVALPACGVFLLLDALIHRLLMNSLGKGAARIWLIVLVVMLFLFASGLLAIMITVPFAMMGPGTGIQGGR